MKLNVRMCCVIILFITISTIGLVFGYNEISYGVPNSNGDVVNEEGPNAPERADLYGILRHFVEVTCPDHGVKTYSTVSSAFNGKYESEIGEVYKDNGEYYVDVVLNGDVYVKLYGLEPVVGVGELHSLTDNEEKTKTIRLVYRDGKWTSGQKKGTILATFQAECFETTYTVIYTDDVLREIIFPDQGYEGLVVGDVTPEYVGETPMRDGYEFLGWEPEVKEFVRDIDADDNGDIIYRAKWRSLSDDLISLCYNVTGGEDIIYDVTTRIGSKVYISNVIPKKNGYKFLGWSFDKEKDDVLYNSGDELILENTTILYAVWEEDQTTQIDGSVNLEGREDSRLEGSSESNSPNTGTYPVVNYVLLALVSLMAMIDIVLFKKRGI